MTERPILFSAPMVQAILAGNKTQTRRVMKNQPSIDADGGLLLGSLLHCPYGQVGDQLWVREAWRKVELGECGCSDYCHHESAGYEYRASGHGDNETKWKPSIHMPRKASRIQLEITNIRVERLQDISEGDALAEGVNHRIKRIVKPFSNPIQYIDITAKSCFQNLWETINGMESWNANPWVWVVEFRRVKP